MNQDTPPGAPLVALDDPADPFLDSGAPAGVPGFALPQEPLAVAPGPDEAPALPALDAAGRPAMPPLDGTHGYETESLIRWHAQHGTIDEIAQAYGARNLRKLAAKFPHLIDELEFFRSNTQPDAGKLERNDTRSAGTNASTETEEAARVIYEAFTEKAAESGAFGSFPTWAEVSTNPKESAFRAVWLAVAVAASNHFQA